MIKTSNKFHNDYMGSFEISCLLDKERTDVHKMKLMNTDKDTFEGFRVSRNEKKDQSTQRSKTFKLFKMIRNSEIGGDKFYLGPYGYKRSKHQVYFSLLVVFLYFIE